MQLALDVCLRVKMIQLAILRKYKNYIRFGLYIISALLILYYIVQIFSISANIDKNIISHYEEQNLINNIDYNNLLKDFEFSQSKKVIDMNEKLGGQILKIALSIINIIFLVMFMLLLFIYEKFEKDE